MERLKASLFGNDPYVRRKYIRDFHSEFRSYRRRIPKASLLKACARADIVFVGDYHALPSCQNFAAELLAALATRGRHLVLFLEMIFSRDQKVLDDRIAGRICDKELMRRIGYERDWGYPWDGYGRLLDAAVRAGAVVVAADAPPRGGLRMIRRRDRHAASTIVDRLVSDPGSRALVLFGESHMARGHLPGEVRAELTRRAVERSSVVVVQNVEDVYWRMLRDERTPIEAVAIDDRRFCVFNASPLAKYEAYRQTLLRWAQQAEEEPDFGPSVHHLIDLLAARLGLDHYRKRVPLPDGRLVPLVDLYPEIVTRRDRRRDRGPALRKPFGRRLGRPGVVYRRAPNRVDVYTFSLASAGEAASRFVMAALRGEAGRPGRGRSRGWPGPGEGTIRSGAAGGSSVLRGCALPLAGVILDEAFVAFSVRFLDPGVPPWARRGEDIAVPRSGRGAAPGRGSLRSLLEAAAGAITARGTGRRGFDREVAMAERIGAQLGDAIYARMRNARPGRATRSWLHETARSSSGVGDSAKGARLLAEAAVQAGWMR